MSAEWRFLIDENLDPQIVRYLKKETLDAAYVPNVLFEGADDDDDILPHAREHDYIFVTNDLQHFSDREFDEHEGIVLVYDGKLKTFEIVSGLLDIVASYPDGNTLRGYEVLDEWINEP